MSIDQPNLAPVCGLVVAAGGSTRMGCPKALLDWFGHPLINAHLMALSHCDVRIVVLGAHAGFIREILPAGIRVLENRSWESQGMSDSVRLGLKDWPGSAIITPVDVVPERAVSRGLSGPHTQVPLDIHGNRGHPVRLSSTDVRRFVRATVALDLFLSHAPTIQTDSPYCAHDFDDPEAWQATYEVVKKSGWRRN